MPRPPRQVLPGIPHHVTQRGNRRQPVFFSDADYARYLSLLGHACRKCGTSVWAWCLMPNHVHLILVPSAESGLGGVLAPVHRNYAWEVNQREGWTGHLWQARFASFPLDEAHLHACLRYVELNPVRARLAEEGPLAAIAALGDVVGQARQNQAGGSGHGRELSGKRNENQVDSLKPGK